jgi:hypothetical protein
MIEPPVTARIEKRDNLLRYRIDTGRVRTFTEVAALTREREIAAIVGPHADAAPLVRHGGWGSNCPEGGDNIRNGSSLESGRAFASPNPSLRRVGKLPAGFEFQNCHKVFGVEDRFIFRARRQSANLRWRVPQARRPVPAQRQEHPMRGHSGQIRCPGSG